MVTSRFVVDAPPPVVAAAALGSAKTLRETLISLDPPSSLAGSKSLLETPPASYSRSAATGESCALVRNSPPLATAINRADASYVGCNSVDGDRLLSVLEKLKLARCDEACTGSCRSPITLDIDVVPRFKRMA
jgi:hypothetical protein